jgi:hypothetical protein
VALARVELQLPVAAVLHGLELVPRQTLGVATVHAADVHEHDCGEPQLLQDGIGARPGVGPGIVEGQEQWPWGQVDRLALHEADEGLEVGRLVARVRDHRHLLGEVILVDPIGCVLGVGEVALRTDAVVEEHGDRGAVRGQGRPHLLLLGGEDDVRSRELRQRGGFVGRAAAGRRREKDAAGKGNETRRRYPHRGALDRLDSLSPRRESAHSP